jgi:hypothetical protein
LAVFAATTNYGKTIPTTIINKLLAFSILVINLPTSVIPYPFYQNKIFDKGNMLVVNSLIWAIIASFLYGKLRSRKKTDK